MSDQITDLIKEVAEKHNIVLSSDDPIMVLSTINQRLLTDFNKALEKNLISFREDVELVSKKWSDDAKAKAERTLMLALDASRENIESIMQNGVEGLPNTIKQTIRSEISNHLAIPLKKVRAFMLLIMLVMGISLIASIIAIVVTFFR